VAPLSSLARLSFRGACGFARKSGQLLSLPDAGCREPLKLLQRSHLRVLPCILIETSVAIVAIPIRIYALRTEHLTLSTSSMPPRLDRSSRKYSHVGFCDKILTEGRKGGTQRRDAKEEFGPGKAIPIGTNLHLIFFRKSV
jgi:hypothetical protein